MLDEITDLLFRLVADHLPHQFMNGIWKIEDAIMIGGVSTDSYFEKVFWKVNIQIGMVDNPKLTFKTL